MNDNGMEVRKKDSHIRMILHLVRMIYKDCRTSFLVLLLVTVVTSLLPVMTARIWQAVLEKVSLPGYRGSGLFLCLAVIGGLSLSGSYFREVLDTVFRHSMSKSMQKRIHEKAGRIPMECYEDASLNDLIERAGDTFFYGEAVGFMVESFYIMQLTFSILFSGILVWGYEPVLIVPFLMIMGAKVIVFKNDKKRSEMETALEPFKRGQEVYKGYLTKRDSIKEMRVMGNAEFFLDKWKGAALTTDKKEEENLRKLAVSGFVSDLIEQAAVVTAYLLCVTSVFRERISIAQFGALIVLLQQFFQDSMTLMRMIGDVHVCLIQVVKSLAYLGLPEEERHETLGKAVDNIVLEDVSFRYPGMERMALQDISLTLRKGQVLAVVGENGSGKSTLSKIISGLIKPVDGGISYDGVCGDEITFSSLYRNSSVVLQDFTKYKMTIRENIQLGDTERKATDEELLGLLSEMEITFISDFDSPLGIEYGGGDLSGGEWQQLAIARAGYKQSAVMILDEPTSALDPLNEAQLFYTFARMCRDKIGVIISHRLSLCSFADHIAVMNEGRLAEYGTHEQLMEQNGQYAGMYRKQADLYGVVS